MKNSLQKLDFIVRNLQAKKEDMEKGQGNGLTFQYAIENLIEMELGYNLETLKKDAWEELYCNVLTAACLDEDDKIKGSEDEMLYQLNHADVHSVADRAGCVYHYEGKLMFFLYKDELIEAIENAGEEVADDIVDRGLYYIIYNHLSKKIADAVDKIESGESFVFKDLFE